MSLTCGFYNSVGGDRQYNAEQMSSLFEGIIKDGIFMSIGQKMMVTPKTGMNITVGTGRAWFNRTWTNNDGEYPLVIPTSDVILNRIDIVVLEINANDSNRANTLKIIKGTPGTIPTPPALILSDKVNQYPLAHIYVPAGAVSVVGGNITNKIGTTACPFIIGVLETMNVDSLLAQWNSAYTAWFNGIKLEGSTLLTSFNSQFQSLFTSIDSDGEALINRLNFEFNTWFNSLTAILDENVAANLTARLLVVEEKTKNGVATAAQGTKADNALPKNGKAADSELLDGKDSTAYATAAQGSKADAALPANGKAADSQLLDGKDITDFPILGQSDADVNSMLTPGMFRLGNNANLPSGTAYGTILVIRGTIGLSDVLTQIVTDSNLSTYMYWRSCLVSKIATTAWVKVWTAGNDGSGSGLDADVWKGKKLYLNPTELGVTQATATIKQIADAMAMPSIYEGIFDGNPNMPSTFCNVYATKPLSDTVDFLVVDRSTGIVYRGTYSTTSSVFTGWRTVYTNANYDVVLIASASFVLTNAHHGMDIYIADVPANITITTTIGLRSDFSCNITERLSGVGITSFAAGVNTGLYSNPNNTKRTLNGFGASVNIRQRNTNIFILRGNLKV